MDFKTRRVSAFKKNLIELSELELKHANVTIIHLYIFDSIFIVGLDLIL